MPTMNVTAKRVTGTGAVGIGRSRLAQVLVTTTNGTLARITITDGQGGATKFDADYNSDTHVTNIPGDGILFDNDPYIVTASNVTAMTLFFM